MSYAAWTKDYNRDSSVIGSIFWMISRLMTLFGGLALLLAAVGLYGVTSYNVARRSSEIGIRMALGAERGGVIAMIMRGAMIQTMLGLAFGIPVALLSVRFVQSHFTRSPM